MCLLWFLLHTGSYLVKGCHMNCESSERKAWNHSHFSLLCWVFSIPVLYVRDPDPPARKNLDSLFFAKSDYVPDVLELQVIAEDKANGGNPRLFCFHECIGAGFLRLQERFWLCHTQRTVQCFSNSKVVFKGEKMYKNLILISVAICTLSQAWLFRSEKKTELKTFALFPWWFMWFAQR